MSIIAFYNNQSEAELVDEYKIIYPVNDDRSDKDTIQILPSHKEVVSALPKYIATSNKKLPKQINYGLTLASLFKDVYDIADEKEAISQKNSRKNMKFLKYLPKLECVY
jgi:hypothetical protein